MVQLHLGACRARAACAARAAGGRWHGRLALQRWSANINFRAGSIGLDGEETLLGSETVSNEKLVLRSLAPEFDEDQHRLYVDLLVDAIDKISTHTQCGISP